MHSNSQELAVLQVPAGLPVGDLFMSRIHIRDLKKVNVFDYLTQLLRNPEGVAVDLWSWMPSNYTVAAGKRP